MDLNLLYVQDVALFLGEIVNDSVILATVEVHINRLFRVSMSSGFHLKTHTQERGVDSNSCVFVSANAKTEIVTMV